MADNVGMQEAKYSTYELRVRAVQAVQRGMTVTEVAHAYQIDRTTLHRWPHCYHQAGGSEGLARHAGSGRPRKLQEMTPEQWRAVILEPASAFGFETDFWTAKRVHQVITQQFAVSVAPRTVIRRLQEAGLSYQKPTREYFEGGPRGPAGVAANHAADDSLSDQGIPGDSLLRGRGQYLADGPAGEDLGRPWSDAEAEGHGQAGVGPGHVWQSMPRADWYSGSMTSGLPPRR